MKSHEMDLTNGNFYKKIFFYAIPLFLTAALQLFYNAADLIVCGLFGSGNSTGAISSTGSISGFLVQFSMGISLGANAIMAKCYGANEKEKGQRVVYSSMIISVVLGLVIATIGVIFADDVLELINAREEFIELSTIYLRIFFISVPFFLIFNFGASLFRAVGDSIRPFIFLTISGVINISLNALFVIVFKMDVAGVAIATVISQFFCATLIVISLLKYKGFFYFKIKELRLHKAEAIEIFQVGLPAGIQNSIFSLSNMIIQSSVNSLGPSVVSGVGASSSIEGFVLTAMNAFGQSAMVFASANYGAKKRNNIKKVILISAMYIILSNLVLGAIILLFRRELIYLYVKTQEVTIRDESISAGVQKMTIMMITYFLCGFMHLCGFAMRGIGKSTPPMIITLAGVCGIRIIWVYTVFPIEVMHNVSGLMISYPISWAITFLANFILLVYFFKKVRFDNTNNDILEIKNA